MADMDQSDIKNFVADIMSFLTKEDIEELRDKAGVFFPLDGCNWSDLCYVCCWMGLKGPLPDSIYNRMMLGEPNGWVEIYVKVKTKEPRPREKMTIEEFFNLAG